MNRREVGRFVAKSDDGNYETTIVVYRNESTNRLVIEPAEYWTIGGAPCLMRDDGAIEISTHSPPAIVLRSVADGTRAPDRGRVWR